MRGRHQVLSACVLVIAIAAYTHGNGPATAPVTVTAVVSVDSYEVLRGEPIRFTLALENKSQHEVTVLLRGPVRTEVSIQTLRGEVVYREPLEDTPLSTGDTSVVAPLERMMVEKVIWNRRVGKRLTPVDVSEGLYDLVVNIAVKDSPPVACKSRIEVRTRPRRLDGAVARLAEDHVQKYFAGDHRSAKAANVALQRVAADVDADVFADHARYEISKHLIESKVAPTEADVSEIVRLAQAVSTRSLTLKARGTILAARALTMTYVDLGPEKCAAMLTQIAEAQALSPWLQSDSEWDSNRRTLLAVSASTRNDVVDAIELCAKKSELAELSTIIGRMKGPFDARVDPQLLKIIELDTAPTSVLAAFALSRSGMNRQMGVTVLGKWATAANKDAAVLARYALRELSRQSVIEADEALRRLAD